MIIMSFNGLLSKYSGFANSILFFKVCSSVMSIAKIFFWISCVKPYFSSLICSSNKNGRLRDLPSYKTFLNSI